MNTIKSKVFIIDDDLSIIDIYSAAFKTSGIHFDTASTGHEAMKKIKEIQEGKKEKPFLVLLDLVLPDINGLEILNTLRQHSITKDIIVFILSNYTSDALLNIKYIKPDKFIVKSSITPTQLVELVKEQMKKLTT